MKQLTDIPSHYRRLGENEDLRMGDLFYYEKSTNRIINKVNKNSECFGEKVKDWPKWTFFRRRHVFTHPLRVAKTQVIAHWTRLATGTSYENEETGMGDCAFCQLIHAKTGSSYYCHGCPIKEFTGKHQCQDTPYVSSLWKGKHSEEFRTKAAVFLEWLKKLPIKS